MNSRIRALIREIRAKDPLCPAAALLEAGFAPVLALRHRCKGRSVPEISLEDIFNALAQEQRDLEAKRGAAEILRALAKEAEEQAARKREVQRLTRGVWVR